MIYRLVILLILFSSPSFSQNWVNYNFNNAITKIYLSPSSNKLIIGGYFTTINNQNNYCITSFDGTTFSPIGSGVNYTASIASVQDITEFNGSLYICGSMNAMGTIKTKSIAKWNGTQWDSLGVPLNAKVNALKVHNNELYVGGHFWKVGNATANAIIKYDGTNWISIGNGVPFITGGQAIVRAIEFYNNDMYLAGDFYDNLGNPFQLAKFDGTNWSKVLALNSSLSEINTLKVYHNNLYIGGRFFKNSGDPGNCIAKYNGFNWSPLDDGIDGNSTPTITEFKIINNKLFITGGFNNVNGNTASSIAYWNDTTFCALNLGSQPIKFLTIEGYNNTLFTGTSFYPLGSVDTVKHFAHIIPSSLNYSCSTVILNSVSENNRLSSKFKVFPNPAQGNLSIISENTDLNAVKLDLTNSLGQSVKFSYSRCNNQIICNLEELSSGIYFLKIHSANEFEIIKFIKQ